MERKRISGYLACLISLAASCRASGPAASQWGGGGGGGAGRGDVDDLFATMERLGISLPMSVAGRDPIRRHLAELSRERCDQQAIVDLGTALDNAGYRREAAGAHVGFSATCGGHAPSLRTAVNILLKLSDSASAVKVATDLIKLEPYSDNGYFLRAVAYERGGSYQRAIDDYVTAIELFGNKDRISSASYFAMARSYERLGRFCDAMVPIETWVSLNPARNDTSQTQAIISDYMKKGNCALATGNEETFPVPRQHRQVTLPVSVYGTRGVFILDTGASFVALKKTFAQKAAVQIDQDSAVRLHTANGITDGRMGRAVMIQLRSLQAKDVPIVVEDDAKAAFGDGVDGLLGMSFLSRFKVTVDAQVVRIASRKAK
jgi:clan AA aspartic protease (TIGR02281 family)